MACLCRSPPPFFSFFFCLRSSSFIPVDSPRISHCVFFKCYAWSCHVPSSLTEDDEEFQRASCLPPSPAAPRLTNSASIHPHHGYHGSRLSTMSIACGSMLHSWTGRRSSDPIPASPYLYAKVRISTSTLIVTCKLYKLIFSRLFVFKLELQLFS